MARGSRSGAATWNDRWSCCANLVVAWRLHLKALVLEEGIAMPAVGLMQHALHLALEEADRRGARRIHRLKLRVGQRSGVDSETLVGAFHTVSRGTPAEG